MVDGVGLGSPRAVSAVRVTALARITEARWALVVWAGAVAWFVGVFAIARALYDHFRFQRFDLGNMVQAVWSTAHGRFLETTLESGEQAPRLASHVDPLLALLTPLWLALPSPLTLVAAQIAACALGAIPVYLLGRRHLSARTAAVLALAYLANPWLMWVALDPIHPATLAIPLLIFAVYFLEADRLWAFAVVAVPAALASELVGLAIAGLGLWYWVGRRQRRAGMVILLLGSLWTILCLELIIPHYGAGESPYYALYSSVGGSPGGVLSTALTNPGTLASELVTRANFVYLVALAAPLAGACLLSPLLLAAAVPQLAINMLSPISAHANPRFHTVSVVLPILTSATVLGIARLSPRRAAIFAGVILWASVAMLVVYGPGSEVRGVGAWYDGTPPEEHIDALRDGVALVPSSAAVAGTTKVGSRLSARRYFFSVPKLGRADWVIVDTLDPWVPLRPEKRRRTTIGRFDPQLIQGFVDRLDLSSDWRKVYERSGVYVFRRARSSDRKQG
jgi:uncharacterized membrane protein